jgi:hypothetical protein
VFFGGFFVCFFAIILFNVYPHSVGFSHWFVIRICSFFAMIRSHVIFAFRWFRSDSLFASIRFSQWFAVMLICYIRIPLVSQWFVIRIYSFFSQWFAVMLDSHSVGFAVIRHLHLLVFRNDSQSCYIRIPLILTLFSLFASFRCFAMILSHVIFAFRWF